MTARRTTAAIPIGTRPGAAAAATPCDSPAAVARGPAPRLPKARWMWRCGACARQANANNRGERHERSRGQTDYRAADGGLPRLVTHPRDHATLPASAPAIGYRIA